MINCQANIDTVGKAGSAMSDDMGELSDLPNISSDQKPSNVSTGPFRPGVPKQTYAVWC